MSKIAKQTGWFRARMVPASLALALALGISGAWAQETASSSNKKAAAGEDLDVVLDVIGSLDETVDPTPLEDPTPTTLTPGMVGFPGYLPGPRLGFGNASSMLPPLWRGPSDRPYSNGLPISAIGPQGTPLGALGGPNDFFARSDSFDVMRQPSAFKYTGSEISLLYGFSSNGASIRAAGFVTSMASNDVQIVVGATFSDQSGLTFPGGRYSPFGNSKFSSQTQQYFGAINYKLLGGSMMIGLDFAVADTKVNGNFRPINRPNQSTLAVVNPNNIGNPKSYNTQLGLSGALPGNMGYQVGLGFEQTTLSGSDGSDLRSLMTPRRR